MTRPLSAASLASSMGIVTLLSTPIATTGDEPSLFEVEPSILRWELLSESTFDLGWLLPEPRTHKGRDLLVEMRNLLALRFDLKTKDGDRYQCFGDLVAKASMLEPEACQPWLAELLEEAPELDRDWGVGVSQLLLAGSLQREAWSPTKDQNDDGLLFAAAWPLDEEQGAPWKDITVPALLEQSAALLQSDLATIKAVENDYREYPNNVGADYEQIFPLDGSYYIGRDPSGRPFSTLRLSFECDLPFPFSTYETLLCILNRFSDGGVLYTDIYSKSEDFYWLAGRDVFLPVQDWRGEWVSYLIVRQFGFDLEGIPDGPKHRREAIRASLGNLKRNAEELFRGRPESYGRARNDPKILDGVRVLGRR